MKIKTKKPQLTFAKILAVAVLQEGAARARRSPQEVRLRLEAWGDRLWHHWNTRSTKQANREAAAAFDAVGAEVLAAEEAPLPSYRRSQKARLDDRLTLPDGGSCSGIVNNCLKSQRQKRRARAEGLLRERRAIVFVLRGLGARPELSAVFLLNQAPTCNPETIKGWDRLVSWAFNNPQYFVQPIQAEEISR